MAKPKSKTKLRKQKTTSPIWYWAGLAVLGIALVAVIVLIQPGGATEATYPAEIRLEEAVEKHADGAFILDVRTPAEWSEYHVPGSTLIPLEELASRVDELPRDSEIVVVCRSGNRSAAGRDALRKAGFDQATSLAGGLRRWKAAGYPTVTGP